MGSKYYQKNKIIQLKVFENYQKSRIWIFQSGASEAEGRPSEASFFFVNLVNISFLILDVNKIATLDHCVNVYKYYSITYYSIADSCCTLLLDGWLWSSVGAVDTLCILYWDISDCKRKL